MGCGASRQNRVEAISDSARLSNPGHPTVTPVRWPERDRAPQIIRASRRLSLPGSFPPHEVQPNTNYHIWSLFSKQGDGLVQRDPTDNNVDCKGAFREKKGRFSLCFNFLFCFFWFLFLFFCVLVFVCHKNNPLHILKVCLVAPSPAMGASSFKKKKILV